MQVPISDKRLTYSVRESNSDYLPFQADPFSLNIYSQHVGAFLGDYPSMLKLRMFLLAIGSDWLARMSGPLTVPFTIAALAISSTKGKILFVILAVIAALVTCYRVWVKEYDRAESEKAKNEAAPHMDIDVLSTIPHGTLQAGLTDLFFCIRLVLSEPNRVSVRDFSLTIFDGSVAETYTAVEDVGEWDLIKKEPNGRRYRVCCVPLIKELTRRGDPVQGWIHIPIPNLPESFVQRRALTIKVNCTYGTCYANVQGAYVRSDPDVKGHMQRKFPITHET